MDVINTPPHQLLRHRPPFIFIDKVLQVDNEARSIKCLKHLAYNEPYFSGHFPEDPIFPGVYMIETAAQASLLLELSLEGEKSAGPRVGYLVRTRDFRFYHAAKPGDDLYIKAVKIAQVGDFHTTKITILNQNNKKMAKGEVVFFLPDSISMITMKEQAVESENGSL